MEHDPQRLLRKLSEQEASPRKYQEVQANIFQKLKEEDENRVFQQDEQGDLRLVLKYAPAFREWVWRGNVPPHLIQVWESAAEPEADEELMAELEDAFIQWFNRTLATFSPELRQRFEEALHTKDPYERSISDIWKMHLN